MRTPKTFSKILPYPTYFLQQGGASSLISPSVVYIRGVHPIMVRAWLGACCSSNSALDTNHGVPSGRVVYFFPPSSFFFFPFTYGTQLLPFPPVCILHLSLLLLLQSSRCQTTTLTLFLFRDTVNSVITLPQQYET